MRGNGEERRSGGRKEGEEGRRGERAERRRERMEEERRGERAAGMRSEKERKRKGADRICEDEKEARLTVIPESDMGKMFFCFTLFLVVYSAGSYFRIRGLDSRSEPKKKLVLTWF